MKLTNLISAVKYDPKTGKWDFGEGFAKGTPESLFATAADTLIFLIGAVSVIMIIVGGFRFVISQGNPQATKAARETILYAVIGVVVAALAYAAVGFVAGRF